MKRNRKPFSWIAALSLLFLSPHLLALEQPFDHSLWDQFLKRFVNEEGEVNYRAVKADPSLLTEYLKKIETLDAAVIPKWPREEKLALLINLYNAGCIAAILPYYPAKTIQAIPGIWDIHFLKMAGHGYSLNQIRSAELLQTFRDEKIHTALACPAKSCPLLVREVYTGPRIEGQLFLAARRFVNDPKWAEVFPAEKKVRISKIFKWYGSDFKLDFGMPDNERGFSPLEYAVLSFIAHYLEDPEKVRFLEEEDFKIKYLEFDWALNDWTA